MRWTLREFLHMFLNQESSLRGGRKEGFFNLNDQNSPTQLS